MSPLDAAADASCMLRIIMAHELTLAQRLSQLDTVILPGSHLLRKVGSLGRLQGVTKPDFEKWLADALQVLDGIGVPRSWCIWPGTRPLSVVAVQQLLQVLFMVRWRIKHGRPTSLDSDAEERMRTAVVLVSFGDYIIDHAAEGRDGVTISVGRAFEQFQQQDLPSALTALQRWSTFDSRNGPIWARSLELIHANVDASTVILGGERGLQWRLGWEIFTLGWQLADSMGDSITLNNLRCCGFAYVKESRRNFIHQKEIICPECRMAIQFNTSEARGRSGLTSAFWHCETCELAGYFPVNARPESVWYEAPNRGTSPKQQNHGATALQPLKILFLGSAPIDAVRLQLTRETREIERNLRESDGGRRFKLIQEWAVQPTELQAILLRHKPHVIHFSGHGNPYGELMFEDAQGASSMVPVAVLGRLFSILGDGISCVVLNACYSEAQANAIREHVPCVVGMRTAIPDNAAIAFASSFYLALGHGESIKRGFDLGCVQIELAGFGDRDTPVLLCQSGTNPTHVAFLVDGMDTKR